MALSRSKFFVALVCITNVVFAEIDPDTGLNTIEIVSRHGYPIEAHFPETEDGYILELHRIPYGVLDNDTTQTRPAVLLMHGLISSSSDWVNMGSNISLAYLLADAGYDVWMGNARGNTWCKKHKTIDYETEQKLFYNFTWHEIGYYDVPAIIDHIIETTKVEKINYIGHSQGGAAFLVMASTRPEYNDNIKLAQLMAPAAFVTSSESDWTHDLIKHLEEVMAFLDDLQIYQIPYLDLVRMIAPGLCIDGSEYQDLCLKVLWMLGGGPDPTQINTSKLSVIATNAPADSGMGQFFHFAQVIRSGNFAQWDYGEQGNMEKYGTLTPPNYDLSKITTKVAIYYGQNDDTITPDNIQKLLALLPNVIDDHLIDYELFNHIDFVFAKDVKELLYDNVLKQIKENAD